MAETNFTHLNKINFVNNTRNRKPATNKDGSTITNNSWKSKTVTKKTKDKEKLKSRDQSIGSNPNKSQKISEFTSPQSSCRQNNGLTNGDGITAAKISPRRGVCKMITTNLHLLKFRMEQQWIRRRK